MLRTCAIWNYCAMERCMYKQVANLPLHSGSVFNQVEGPKETFTFDRRKVEEMYSLMDLPITHVLAKQLLSLSRKPKTVIHLINKVPNNSNPKRIKITQVKHQETMTEEPATAPAAVHEEFDEHNDIFDLPMPSTVQQQTQHSSVEPKQKQVEKPLTRVQKLPRTSSSVVVVSSDDDFPSCAASTSKSTPKKKEVNTHYMINSPRSIESDASGLVDFIDDTDEHSMDCTCNQCQPNSPRKLKSSNKKNKKKTKKVCKRLFLASDSE